MSESPETNETKTQPQCVCAGAGPAMSELFRKFGPPEAAKQHFTQARVELLKGLRALIDARIQDLTATPSRGTKLNVE